MRVLSVSTGMAAPLFASLIDTAPRGTREQVISGIRKVPVSTLAEPRRIVLGPLGFEGDEQVDLTVHGGRDKAVYAYPIEHYGVWRTIREQATRFDEPLPHGFVGENLTVEGLLENRVWIGDVLVIGPAAMDDAADDAATGAANAAPPVRLRIDAPRGPCFKFNARMGFPHAAKMMVQSAFTGFYLEVLETGTVAAGDTIRIVAGTREVTVEEMHRLITRGRPRDLL